MLLCLSWLLRLPFLNLPLLVAGSVLEDTNNLGTNVLILSNDHQLKSVDCRAHCMDNSICQGIRQAEGNHDHPGAAGSLVEESQLHKRLVSYPLQIAVYLQLTRRPTTRWEALRRESRWSSSSWEASWRSTGRTWKACTGKSRSSNTCCWSL
jgi:hypothetical protein